MSYEQFDLDDEILEFIRRVEAARPAAAKAVSLDTQRRLYRELAQSFNAPRPPSIQVTDHVIETPAEPVPVRLYHPARSQALPTLVYYHGGGWVVGDLDTHDSITAEIADRANVNVMAVDYRLAPEYPYPAAFDDAYRCVTALAGDGESYGIDGSKLAVGGDSAGGNLAAAVCLKARAESGPRLLAQILIYPVLAGNDRSASYADKAQAPMLTRADMLAYFRHYLGERFPTDDPYAAPLAAADLSGLPPAYIVTAQHDPLWDDGRRYALALRAAGVSCDYVEGGGLVHGFLRARHVSVRARAAMDSICDAAGRLLHGAA